MKPKHVLGLLVLNTMLGICAAVAPAHGAGMLVGYGAPDPLSSAIAELKGAEARAKLKRYQSDLQALMPANLTVEVYKQSGKMVAACGFGGAVHLAQTMVSIVPIASLLQIAINDSVRSPGERSFIVCRDGDDSCHAMFFFGAFGSWAALLADPPVALVDYLRDESVADGDYNRVFQWTALQNDASTTIGRSLLFDEESVCQMSFSRMKLALMEQLRRERVAGDGERQLRGAIEGESAWVKTRELGPPAAADFRAVAPTSSSRADAR